MNIAQYYKDITVLVKMQLGDTADYFWQGTKVNPQTKQAQTIVYLGCNVLRTLHLAAQFVSLVSVYHSCHRALVRAAKRQGIACVNYVDLVAERAGLQVRDRFGHFMELGNEELIWAEVADYFSPKDEEVARRVIRDFFAVSVARNSIQ